jgi:hypothetical protein
MRAWCVWTAIWLLTATGMAVGQVGNLPHTAQVGNLPHTTQVGNLPHTTAGPANLVRNPSFEEDRETRGAPDGWQAAGDSRQVSHLPGTSASQSHQEPAHSHQERAKGVSSGGTTLRLSHPTS